MKEDILARIELIAALAKSLAFDYAHGKLWDGELDIKLGQIHSELNKIPKERN